MRSLDPIAAMGVLLLKGGREGEGVQRAGEGLTPKGREGRGGGLLLRGTEGESEEGAEREGKGIPPPQSQGQ